MWRSHLSTALRQAARNRLEAAISVAGLAVGMAAAIVIGLYVENETRWNAWIPGSAQVFRIGAMVHDPAYAGDETDRDAPMGTFAALLADVPDIAAATRLGEEARGFRYGDREYFESELAAVDGDFFKVFPVPLRAGDPARALASPDSLVMSEAMARKYFGDGDPIGRTVTADGKYALTVTGVMADLPYDTTFRPDALISGASSFTGLHRDDVTPLEPGELSFNSETYVRLAHGADLSAVDRALETLAPRHAVPIPTAARGDTLVRLFREPIRQIHLDLGDFNIVPDGKVATLSALTAVAAVVVGVAAMNLVNLTTARATRRAVEVGVRKAAGASPWALRRQFLAETALKVAAATVLAVALTELAMPAFNALFGRSIAFDYWRRPELAGAILLVAAATALAAGLYPALLLSRFRAAPALKGLAPAVGGGRMREAMVAAQFAATIALAVATLCVWRQTVYATGKALEFDRQNLLLVKDRAACLPAFRAQVAALPGVAGIACSEGAPLFDNYATRRTRREGRPPIETNVQPVDYGFFRTVGVGLRAGRDFDPARTEDRAPVRSRFAPASDLPPLLPPAPPANGQPWSVVLNRTAVRALGFADAAAAVGQTILLSDNGDGETPVRVIGVADDLRVRSVRQPVDPATFYVDDSDWRQAVVRLRPGDPAPTLAAVDAAWRAAAPRTPIRREFLDTVLDGMYRDVAREATVFGAMAALAVVIACLGLLGLSAFAAERRTREIGVRKALGATTADVVRLLLWQFTRPVLIANVVAWPVAFLAMRSWLGGFADHAALELWPFLAAGGAALALALGTVSAHAVRVARARPVRALRHE